MVRALRPRSWIVNFGGRRYWGREYRITLLPQGAFSLWYSIAVLCMLAAAAAFALRREWLPAAWPLIALINWLAYGKEHQNAEKWKALYYRSESLIRRHLKWHQNGNS